MSLDLSRINKLETTYLPNTKSKDPKLKWAEKGLEKSWMPPKYKLWYKNQQKASLKNRNAEIVSYY